MLKNKLITVNWKHKILPYMHSNDEAFLSLPGFDIFNDRDEEDYAVVADLVFKGM